MHILGQSWGAALATDYMLTKKLENVASLVLSAPETVRYYQKNTPGSEIFVFGDASHQHHLEKPEEYVQVVRSFLRRIEEK